VLRSTLLEMERIRVEAAAAKWDVRVSAAITRLEGASDRLDAVERTAREAKDTARATSNKVAASRR
jgi:hypothetical protein